METDFSLDDSPTPSGNDVDHDREIAGRRIAVIGKLEAMNRREVRDFIRERGGLWADEPQSAELVVVGAGQVPFDELESLVGNEILDAAAAGQLEIIPEARFWQIVGLVEHDPQVKRLYTAAMLARLLDVPSATIRRWHRRGLIVPVHMVHRLAYYDFQEVANARRLAQLIQTGASPSAIEAKLSRLSDWFPEIQRPLTQLSVIVEGKDVLLRKGEGLIEPSGQRRIDFAALEPGPQTPRTEAPSPVLSASEFVSESFHSTPEQQLKLANALEDDQRYTEAILVYRGMLLAFGPNAEVNFALAELLYLQGETAAARERYYTAVELDDSFVEARASLGCVLLETGERELAISTFEGALAIHPDYADVHFHIARALDAERRPVDAAVHWQRFLELAPESPWADEARSQLALVNAPS